MRIVVSALQKCWILFKSQYIKESTDLETDEGPLRKHRRLTLDHWTAVTSTAGMDRLRGDLESRRASDGFKSGRKTRDVGILCSDLVPVNDKCIMVGTTGIAALKAEYGDDFTNFEIIQDIGYSSESSTHLSGDDGIGVGGDRYYNIRVYNYNNSPPSMSLKEELENAASRQFHSLGSSLGSSSLDDSGLGTNDLLASGDSGTLNSSGQHLEDLADECGNFLEGGLYSPEEESDYLETVLDTCGNFGVNDGGDEGSDAEILHFSLSGLESDDPSDNFHNRSSFTTSAQVFYKMISVDSDGGELDNRVTENSNIVDNCDLRSSDANKPKSPDDHFSSVTGVQHTFDLPRNIPSPHPRNEFTSDSEPEAIKIPTNPKSSTSLEKNSYRYQKILSSTPIQYNQDEHLSCSFRQQNLKRKRDSDSTDFATTWQGGGGTSNRVRSWLKRCADYPVPRKGGRRSLFRNACSTSSDNGSQQRRVRSPVVEDVSSCDASCEYTSSSADEGNALSSSSSFYEDDGYRVQKRVDSCSVEGSIETVLHALSSSGRTGSDLHLLLPPPPPSSTSPCSGRTMKGNRSCSCRDHQDKRSCKQACHLYFKASSEGDVRASSLAKTKQIETDSDNKPRDEHQSKRGHSNTKSNQNSRLCSSLPNILQRHSDGSAEDSRTSLLSHSDTKTASASNVRSTNLSGSSEFGKQRRRRSRKKSSSSNRSSRSVVCVGDGVRNRSRTLTSTTLSLCGSRMRHFSQRSDFFAESEKVYSDEEWSPSEIKVATEGNEEDKTLSNKLELVLDDKLELGLGDSCKRRDSSALLSPIGSDIVFTHLEEQSTVSDQVWDGYQEMPYLSEAYSETTVDEDAIRKLTEFGDDYGSAIGLPIRILDAADSNNNRAEESRSPSKKATKIHHLSASQRLSSLSNDSDSDLEDLHHFIEDAGNALHFAQAILKRKQSGELLTPAEYADLLATCGTHLGCLQTICKHIKIDGKKSNFSAKDLKQLQYLIREWELLRRSTEMYEKAEDHAQQKYLKAQESIDALFNKMSELSSFTHLEARNFKSWDELKENISKLQMVLSTLQETKEQLLAVNLQVHRFTTEYGDDLSYKDCSLKEDVTELYRQWENVYEHNNTQLTELETLSSRWEEYEKKHQYLRCKVKEAELLSGEGDCDKICLTIDDDESENLKDKLKNLRYDAGYLEGRLKGGVLWKTIDKNLCDLGRRIDKQTHAIPASRSVNHQISSITVEDDTDDHFEDAIQQLEDSCYDTADSEFTIARCAAKKDVPKKKPSRFWRVIRVAVPVQFALVLLYCLACYLEPHCCDMLNNFNFSLTPQLRYMSGHPPV